MGLDLGTASIVLVVLDGEGRPLTWEMEECAVVRDGLVVDFAGARVIVARLKERLEGLLGRELTRTTIAGALRRLCSWAARTAWATRFPSLSSTSYVKQNFELHLKECEWRYNRALPQLLASLKLLVAKNKGLMV